MFDAQPSLAEPTAKLPGTPTLARSEGTLRLALKRSGGHTGIERLFQSGCLRARFAGRVDSDTVLVNTAGGLTGGDALSIAIAWGAGAEGTVTGQAAEKIYRSTGEPARITTTLDIGPGARSEWLPQETILFNAASLERNISVFLAPDAQFLGVEAVVFGRTAMGESVIEGRLRDAWRIWRDGRLIYADALALQGPIATVLRKPTVARGSIAVATVLRVGPDAMAMRDRVRAVFGEAPCCAASSWNGLLAVRIAAPDGQSLRCRLTETLRILRSPRGLPRLWQC